jgi:uncharacterized protein (DUF934 family)
MMTTDRNEPDWVIFDGDASRIPAGADVLIPLDEWRERAAVWRARAGRVGVLLAPSDDPSALAADLDQLSLVAYASVRRGRTGGRVQLQLVPVGPPASAGTSLRRDRRRPVPA